jgi:hypothetical protein
MLGLDWRTVQRYIAAEKVPAPPLERVGGGKFRIWTDKDIEKVRKLLPKIANGRKTRYQKLREKQEPPAGAPVPHKPHKTKKK